MYRQRRRFPLRLLIIFGVIAGVAFLIFDQSRQATPEVNQADLPTQTPVPEVVQNPDATATPQFSGQLAVTPSPTPIIADDLGPDIENAALVIPGAGIVAPIVEVYLGETTWDVTQLGNNIGHLEGTRWVKETGNVVLSGHVELADGRAGIFANLGELQSGDRVIITQNGIDYHYDVSSISRHDPTDLTPIYPSQSNKLTLITCGTYDFVSDTYLERIVVIADQVVVNES